MPKTSTAKKTAPVVATKTAAKAAPAKAPRAKALTALDQARMRLIETLRLRGHHDEAKRVETLPPAQVNAYAKNIADADAAAKAKIERSKQLHREAARRAYLTRPAAAHGGVLPITKQQLVATLETHLAAARTGGKNPVQGARVDALETAIALAKLLR
jgi:hypothetical protein